jgi:hypothetical protein
VADTSSKTSSELEYREPSSCSPESQRFRRRSNHPRDAFQHMALQFVVTSDEKIENECEAVLRPLGRGECRGGAVGCCGGGEAVVE